jgi:signal transduction histidine kinase
MLTGLVIQWLRSQWQDEEELLKKDITLLFRESTSQILDSLLVKDLIVPVLNDSSRVSDHLIRIDKNNPVTRGHTDQHISGSFKKTEDQRKPVDEIAHSDRVNSFQHGEVAFSHYDSVEKDLLLRGVKLFIDHTKTSFGKGNQIKHLVSSPHDTVLLKRIFESKLSVAGRKYDVRWTSGYHSGKKENAGSEFYLESNLLSQPFGAEIINMQKNVLKGLYPQVLFAFVLLLVTAAAFIFTWRSLKKMETLNTLRNDFISNISHELKTPVSTVTVALESLKNYDRLKNPVKSVEYLDIACKEMKRLDLLVTQVLNTSMLEDQSEFIQVEEVDLVSLSREVLNSMEIRVRQQGANVKFKADHEVVLLNLDKLHIQGVIINLIDNCLKYGGDNPEIGVSIEQKSSAVLLRICDNGPGIPDEYLKKVFDKFFRVPMGDMHNVKGHGLGLSFADLVMKHHSGSISVRNLRQGGCEFLLSFPIPDK